MNRNSSDSNLLFGILALQMDFVRKEQLIEAMQAWVLEKDTSVAEHLIRAGALRSEHRELLEPLVVAQVQRCEADPETSITSERAFATICDELKQIKDRDLEASIDRICAATFQDLTIDVPKGNESSKPPSAEGDVLPSTTRFRILRTHAEGGLGQVFIAKDEDLGREVALKEIKSSKAKNLDNRARFTREAEITGGLEHPGIVPVYGLGASADGRPFYAMRFIRGSSLKEAIQSFHSAAQTSSHALLSQRNIELRRLLQRFICVCETIDYAHSRGVMHRDIKPSNIMLGRYGETLVVDWGLAKPITVPSRMDASSTPSHDASSGAHPQPHPRKKIELVFDTPEEPLTPTMSGSESMPTLDGAALGTPPFMSPEQAAGRIDLLGPASDIFSLGATLFAILTGRAPYKAPTLSQVLRLAQACSYPTPRSLKRDIPLAIEAVCLKAMSERPSNRYRSAKELAEDIERFLADEPVLARRESLSERAGRFVRRNRTWITAASAISLITVVSVAISFWLIHQAHQAKQLSDVKLQAASQKSRSNELLALTNQMTTRRVARSQSWIAENRRDLDVARRLAESNDVRLMLRNELAAIECAMDLNLHRTFTFDFEASRLAVTSDGKHLARGSSRLKTAQVLLHILNAQTGEIEKKLSFLLDLKFAIDVKGADGIKALAYSPRDRFLLAGTRSGWIYQWSLPDYELVRHWHGHSNWVNQFLFDPSKADFWTCSNDGAIKRWSLETGLEQAGFTHSEAISSIGLIGHRIVLGGKKTAVLTKDELTPASAIPSGIENCDAIAQLGKFDALAICQPKSIIIQNDWSLAEPQSLFARSINDFHGDPIQGVRTDPGCRWLVTFDSEQLRAVDFASGEVFAQMARGNSIYDVQFHPTEPRMYVSTGKHLEEYRLHTSASMSQRFASPFPILAIAMDEGGRQLASVSHQPGITPRSSLVTIGTPDASDCAQELEIDAGSVLHLEGGPDGRRLFVADPSAGNVHEIDTSSLKIQVHQGLNDPKNLAYSKVLSNCLFVSKAERELRYLIKSSPHQLSKLTSPDHPAESLWINRLSNATQQRSDLTALAVHENLVAISSSDERLRLLDLTAADEENRIVWENWIRETQCNAIALTSDHQRVIAGDNNGLLHVFSVEGRRDAIRQLAHREAITAIALSESGILVSGSQDHWLKLWRLGDEGLEPICEMGPFPQSIAQLRISQDGALCAILFHKSRAVHLLRVDALLEQFRSLRLLPSPRN